MTRTPGQRASIKQEKDWARQMGGRRNPGSGNGWVYKNDVRDELYSHELKYTGKKSFSLKLDDLLTAEKNALADGKDMVFVLNLGGRNWTIMADYTFQTLRAD